ncbi:MAG: hypothetical protein R8G33_00245 [Gammaproteobacteria bacterium]|nr:hypothetical protein [Gammaproteobacteria bacterium]
MAQLGDISKEAERLAESAGDALTDDIVGRLAEVAGDGLVLLDQANRSNLDKALPAISRMVENGDLDRVVNLARVMGAAGDAMTDDIVSRVAETGGELMCIADRLARSEGLLRLLDLLEREHIMNLLLEFAEAAAAAKASHEPASKGGVMGMMGTMQDPDVQDALKFFGAMFKELKKA